MYKKDDVVTLTIDDIGVDGEGIGKIDGYTVFVKDAIIGDTVTAKIIKAKKNYGYGRLLEVIEPSKDRVNSVCPVARQCGGCQLQQMSYEAQLEFKANKVRKNIERIGGLTDFEFFPIIGMDKPYNYRNKAQYPVGLDKNGEIVMGFYAGRTHSIISCTDCAIGARENAHILKMIRDWMSKYSIKPYNEVTKAGLIRHILIRNGYHTKEIMVCFVINANKLPSKKEAAFREIAGKLCEDKNVVSVMVNFNDEDTNVILGRQCDCISGKSYIEDYIGDIKFGISPLSFFQVNPVQTEKLYKKALEFAGLTGNETVWDMYCGIGTISLFLAKNAKKVYGVEIVPQAIEDARNNAILNNITNTEFFVGKAEEVVPEFASKNPDTRIDVVVVDPPRKGCDETLLNTIARMQSERVVYVSCDSATLARDLKIMDGLGYKTVKVQPVDQFPHSVHVETVVLLSQQKPDDYVEVELELDELDVTSAERR
ncbi:MAG: 23S rRNA (uracil(1939)-C(5))-methyltransferase RlmD [Lachnospira sp.]